MKEEVVGSDRPEGKLTTDHWLEKVKIKVFCKASSQKVLFFVSLELKN